MEQFIEVFCISLFRSFGLATAERGGRIPEPFYPWAERLARKLIADKDPARIVEGVQVAGELRLGALYEPLAEIAASTTRPAPLRVAAMQACFALDDARRLGLFDAVLGNPSEEHDVRRGAVSVRCCRGSFSRASTIWRRLMH